MSMENTNNFALLRETSGRQASGIHGGGQTRTPRCDNLSPVRQKGYGVRK